MITDERNRLKEMGKQNKQMISSNYGQISRNMNRIYMSILKALNRLNSSCSTEARDSQFRPLYQIIITQYVNLNQIIEGTNLLIFTTNP